MGISREIWCSDRETGRFDEELEDFHKNRENWQVCDRNDETEDSMKISLEGDMTRTLSVAIKGQMRVTNIVRA